MRLGNLEKELDLILYFTIPKCVLHESPVELNVLDQAPILIIVYIRWDLNSDQSFQSKCVFTVVISWIVKHFDRVVFQIIHD